MQEKLDNLIEELSDKLYNSLDNMNNDEELLRRLTNLENMDKSLYQYLLHKSYNDNTLRRIHINETVTALHKIVTIYRISIARMGLVDERLDRLHESIIELKKRKASNFFNIMSIVGIVFWALYTLNPSATGATLDFFKALFGMVTGG